MGEERTGSTGSGRSSRELGEVARVDSMPAVPPLRPMVPVWPHLLFRELLAVLVCFIVILALGILFNAPLEAPADPAATPNPAKAPWYFVGLQELLVYFDPWIAGVMIPVLIIVGLSAIPYLDPSREGEGVYSFRDRPVAWSIFTLGMLGWFALIAVGSWFRGPGWSWVWPWGGGGSVVVSEASHSLPNWLGLPLLLIYFVGGGYGVLRWIRDWPGLSEIRRVVFTLLLLSMVGVVIKILANLIFGLRYFVSFPGVGWNV